MTSLRRFATLLESFEPLAHVEPETLAETPHVDPAASEEPATPPLPSTPE